MTVPVPAPTDPAADAALHIRNLAEGFDARLAAAAKVVRAFSVAATADGAGAVYVMGDQLTGMTKVTGATFGPVAFESGTHGNDHNYIPALTRVDNNNNTITFKCYNAPDLALNSGKWQQVCGLAWGPRSVADLVEPAANPGDTFARGTTPIAGLRYPGTNEAQWKTADFIHDLADDTGKAIGGPVGLNLVSWRAGPITLNASGYYQVAVAGLSRIRGAILSPWDTGTFVRKSRVIAWIPPSYTQDGGVQPGNVLRFRAYTNVAYASAPSTYPKPAYNDTLGVMGVLWGDL